MKRILSAMLILTLCAAMLPATAAAAGKKVYVSSTGKGTLNLREGPGKSSAVKGYVQHGDTVTAKKSKGEWSKVQVARTGQTGWIKTKYFDGTTKKLGTGLKKVKLSAGGSLNLRGGPGTGYAVKGSVKSGDTLKVLNTEDDWVRVQVSRTGRTGWIKQKYVGGTVKAAAKSTGKASTKKSAKSTAKKASTAKAAGSAPGVARDICHVTGAALNLRSGPGTGYGVIGSLSSGTPFKLTDTSGNWYKIETFNGAAGWLLGSYAARGANATVTASSLNLRSGPGTGYGIAGSLAKGTAVQVDSVTGNWAHVAIGWLTGYVSLSYLSF